MVATNATVWIAELVMCGCVVMRDARPLLCICAVLRSGFRDTNSNYQIGKIGVNQTKCEIPVIKSGHFACSYTIV